MVASTTVPRFSAGTLEVACRALAAAVRREQIANLVAVLKVSENINSVRNTKWERLFSAVWEAQARQGDGRPLLRLVGEVMDLVQLESPEDFEAHRLAISERLLSSGYRVRTDGKVARNRRASAVPEASQPTDLGTQDEAPRVSWWKVAGALLDAYSSQPYRQAEVAHERGDKFFRCEVEDGDGTARALERVEEQGWRLENASYEERGGTRVGLYLFRRA